MLFIFSNKINKTHALSPCKIISCTKKPKLAFSTTLITCQRPQVVETPHDSQPLPVTERVRQPEVASRCADIPLAEQLD